MQSVRAARQFLSALFPLAATLAGCLLLEETPSSALGRECNEDEECAADEVCYAGSCQEECLDENCPGGFTCRDYGNECRTYCTKDDDCQPGWYCCDFHSDGCDSSSEWYQLCISNYGIGP